MSKEILPSGKQLMLSRGDIMRRILSFLITLCLFFEMFPNLAFANEPENIAPSARIVPLTVRSSNDHLLVTDGIKDVSKNAEGWQVRKESCIRFDFGKMATFNKMVIYEVNTTKAQRLKGYKIEVSQNLEDWETLAVKDATNLTCPDIRDDKHFKGEIEFERVTARFVKVTILAAEDPSGNANKNIGYVEEIEIFDTKPDVKSRVISGSPNVKPPEDLRTEIKTVDYSGIMEGEFEWLLNQQIHMPESPIDGAFVRNKSHVTKHATSKKNYHTIEPYFANLACLGILDIPNEKSIEAVKKWVDWYIRHINREPDKYGITGTIYTRQVNADDYNDYWSTDDYSASDSRGTTFLLLVKKFYDVTGDKQYLIERKADLELILDSAIFTMRDDGLTDTKNQEGHYTKYLQDNIQVLMGLRAIAELERTALNDNLKADHYQALADKSAKGIEGMWMEDKQEYIYYINPNRTRLCDWNVFYGDAVSEVFPILYDAIDTESDRAQMLYKRFNTAQPGRVIRSKKNDFPWMATTIISAKMNDRMRTDEHLYTMKERYMDSGRKWPWYIFESGNALRAAKEMKTRLNLAGGKKGFVDGSENLLANDNKLETSTYGKSVVIDLGEEKLATRAVLKANSAYNLYWSNDNVNYNSLGTSGADVFDFAKIKARYFKFEIPQGATIREAEIYYNPENLFKKKISVASTEIGKAFDANDNSTATKWISEVEEKPSLTVDLGVMTEIDSVEILWDYENYPDDFVISISNDKKTFIKVAEGKSNRGNQAVSFPLKEARYVKIEGTGTKPFSMGIFEIFGYNHSGSQIIKDNDLYKIYVDRVKIPFDVDPLILNNRLLVPFRAICEALFMEVGWNDTTQTVTAKKGDISIEMVIGNADINVSGNITKSDVAPTLHNSRTVVPLRFLAEAIGCYVGWDGDTNTVTITTK